MNTFTTVASGVVLSLALNAAYAEEAPKSMTVQFADLDLNQDAGAATLFNRIKGAAKKVCSTYGGGTTLRDKQQHAACIDFALSNAVARVDRLEPHVPGTRIDSEAAPESRSARIWLRTRESMLSQGGFSLR